ncbi:MAG: AMP-binding protein, partial [Desulfobacterales bacterium]
MNNRPWQRHYDYNVPLSIRYPRIPAHYFLNTAASNFPNKPATNFFGTQITFWDLKQQVLQMARAMSAIGVKKGDRVGIHLPNCPQYIIAYYAAQNLGAVVVNLNPMYTVDELKMLTVDTGVSTLFTFDMVLPNIRPLCKQVDIARVVVTRVTDYIEGFGQSTPEELELEEGWHHFSVLLENTSSTRLPRIDIMPDDPALIQFTGGTTGLPKGAILTHANLVAATLQCSLWGSAFTDLTSPENRSVMSILPFFHVYG